MVRWGTTAALCILSIVAPVAMRPQPEAKPPAAVIVRPGETLWDHAKRMTPPGGDVRATVDDLARVNGMDGGRRLLAGMRLVLPSGSSLTANLSEGDGPATR